VPPVHWKAVGLYSVLQVCTKIQEIFALMLLETKGKFQHKMLTLSTGFLSIGQRQNTWRVTNSIAKIIQESNFRHDSCKNVAKKITSWCCGILLQNNDSSVK
jgi:hypothetical protein